MSERLNGASIRILMVEDSALAGAMNSAVRSRMRRTMEGSGMPTARAASIWPCGTAPNPERKISAK